MFLKPGMNPYTITEAISEVFTKSTKEEKEHYRELLHVDIW